MHILKNKLITSLSKEVKLSRGEETVSRTDIHGNIIYYNNTFSKISGYQKSELLQLPHSILRHPDMPQAIFYFIWKTLLAGNSTYALVKNFTKDGNYYWQVIKFIVQKNNENSTVSFLSHGKQAHEQAIHSIEPLYKRLLKKEKQYGMDSSIKTLLSFLNSNNIASYNDYICRMSYKRRNKFFLV